MARRGSTNRRVSAEARAEARLWSRDLWRRRCRGRRAISSLPATIAGREYLVENRRRRGFCGRLAFRLYRRPESTSLLAPDLAPRVARKIPVRTKSESEWCARPLRRSHYLRSAPTDLPPAFRRD